MIRGALTQILLFYKGKPIGNPLENQWVFRWDPLIDFEMRYLDSKKRFLRSVKNKSKVDDPI